VAVALTAPSGTAMADKYKDCGPVAAGGSGGHGQGNNYQWEETQISACHSASDTGETTTNGGGHVVK
jgi:hypothetical protein